MSDHAAIRALATRLFDSIERGDVEAVADCYAPELVVWHNFDNVDQPRAENLATLQGLIERIAERRYEHRRLDVFDGGFVQQHVLTGVRGRYDRIVLDCPPISAVSDPLIISAMSDGVVFVTKFNKIRREHARKSVQRVQDAGIHILGVVLNDIDFEGKDSYYYSYYYYKPYASYASYDYHYCIYYPSYPRYVYYYNPYTRVYWGRYDTEAKGYSLLAVADRKESLKDIPEAKFPAPAKMPDVPESEDKVSMEAPPAPPKTGN